MEPHGDTLVSACSGRRPPSRIRLDAQTRGVPRPAADCRVPSCSVGCLQGTYKLASRHLRSETWNGAWMGQPQLHDRERCRHLWQNRHQLLGPQELVTCASHDAAEEGQLPTLAAVTRPLGPDLRLPQVIHRALMTCRKGQLALPSSMDVRSVKDSDILRF